MDARGMIRWRGVSIMRVIRAGKAQSPKLYGNLVTMPLMTIATLKTDAFNTRQTLYIDQRSALLLMFSRLGAQEMETLLRPRCLPLHLVTGNGIVCMCVCVCVCVCMCVCMCVCIRMCVMVRFL